MPMTDGNPTPDTTQKVTATVDPVAVAQLVRELQRQEKQDQPQESRFQKKLNSLISSKTVDQENLKEITELLDAKTEDLKAELAKNANLQGGQSMQQRYAEAAGDALEKYIEGDDALEHVADDLQARVLKKLAKDPDVNAKFNNGQLDKRKVAEAAKEVVEDYSKKVLKRDGAKKGVTMTQSNISGSAASKAIENSPPAGSIDDITEAHRREAYFKLNALFTRNRMSKEDAHAKAYAMATKNYRKSGSAA